MPKSGVLPNNTARVVEELRALILAGDLEPAARLRADALAKRMGTSRTPVREALLVLEREGLVENLPNRGAVVRSFDADDLLDLYEVRGVLEPLSASRAAERITPEGIEQLNVVCEQAEKAGRSGSQAAVKEQILLNNLFHDEITKTADSLRLLEALKGTAGIPSEFRTMFWANDDQRRRSLSLHREILWAIERHDAALAGAAMGLHINQSRQFLKELVEQGGLPAER